MRMRDFMFLHRERASELIQNAISRSPDPITVEDVFTEIEQDRAEVFFTGSSIVVITMHDTHGIKSAHAWLAAGDLDEITQHLVPVIEAWAKRNEAQYATINARRGWARALRLQGYREQSVTLSKDLSDG